MDHREQLSREVQDALGAVRIEEIALSPRERASLDAIVRAEAADTRTGARVVVARAVVRLDRGQTVPRVCAGLIRDGRVIVSMRVRPREAAVLHDLLALVTEAGD